MDQAILCSPNSLELDSALSTSISGPVIDTGGLYLLVAPPPAVDRLMDALAVRLALAAVGRGGAESHLPHLRILDGGNRFDLHAIARGLAGGIAGNHAAETGGSIQMEGSETCTRVSRIDTDQVIYPCDPCRSVYQPPAVARAAGPGGSIQVEAILQRIIVARAFTCYQMEALLAAAAEAACIPGVPAAPVLAPRLLATFADENVRPGERLRLLQRCLQDLKRLARSAPVLVSATPLPAGADTTGFLSRLEAAADQIWRFEAQADKRARPAGTRRQHHPAAAPGQLRLF